MKRIFVLLAMAGCAFGLPAIDLTQKAPEIAPSEWLKGEAFSLSGENAVSVPVVLVFYQTYHPMTEPMLHTMNELAERYGDQAVLLAVSVESEDIVRESPYFEKMNFSVATDEGALAEAYMDEREQWPLAFIIDRDKVVAWIGSPVLLEEPLDMVVSGEYSLDEVAEPFLDRIRVEVYLDNGNYADALKLIDKMLETEPDDESLVALKTRTIFAGLKRYDEAMAYLKSEIRRLPESYLLRLVEVGFYRELENYSQVDACYRKLAADFAAKPVLLLDEAENQINLGLGRMRLGASLVLARTAWESPQLSERFQKARAGQALAQVYYWLGRLDLAIRIQEETLEKYLPPTGPEADKALKRLVYYREAYELGKSL